MKIVELSESIADVPPDVIERLNTLLIKPLRDQLLVYLKYPSIYRLFDILDEVVNNKTYQKSPRRKQAIALLFPYVMQNLDELIKHAKIDGSNYVFTRIRKLVGYSIDNEAVAEVLEQNKDKLLTILKSFIDATYQSSHNVGRSSKEGEIVDIVHALDHAGIDWIELKDLYKRHFYNRYSGWLSQPQDKWGTNTVFNVLNDMSRHKLTIDDLDEELANRLQSMKSTILNRSLFNFRHDSVRYGLVEMGDYYKKLRRLGFDWPELQISGLDQFKTPIMRELLTLFKEQNVDRAAKIVAELKQATDWPELAAMEQSLGTKQIDEELHPARIKAVDESLRNGDYIGAAHYMGVYGVSIDEFDKRVRKRFEEMKTEIVREMLQVVRHISLDRGYKLISNVRKSGLGWPEIDIIFNSLDKSYTEQYR